MLERTRRWLSLSASWLPPTRAVSPSCRNGKVVGVVARSDLLRALEEPHGDGWQAPA